MNPQEKDNRAENRDEKRGDDRIRDEKRKEKSDKPSRLGKEAKIGAAVILVLLITLAAVVVARVMKSDTDEKAPPAVADHDGGKHKSPPGAKEDPLFRDMNAKSFGSHQPTVVPPAKDAASNPFGSGHSRWEMPANKPEPKPVVNRYALPDAAVKASPSAPPSFASIDPPKPRPSRYDPIAAEPLRNRDADRPSRFDKKPDAFVMDPPDMKKKSVRADSVGAITRDGFERGDASGFAAAAPPRREKSRYDDQSAALLPPPRDNAPVNGGRGYAGASASRYDDDFPPASSNRDFDRPRSHRNEPASFTSQASRRNDGKYEVQPGDNYSKISQTVYGTNAYFKALAEQNRGKIGNEDRLTPGDIISTPAIAQLEKTYPELCPKAGRRETQESRTMAVSTRQSYRGGRAYTVVEGDTLFNIARYELGKASRWAEIYDLNRDVLGKDYNYLTPGMQLVLPDNEKNDVLTRKSSELYR
jgi:nucleoid-associated protein YgaU